ncbi:MAG: RCC1 domain-containing protein, partial [Streptosporangiaceae bacterium]
AASAPAVSPDSSGPTVYTFGVVGSLGAITALQHDKATPVTGIEGKVVQIASSNSDGYALTSAGTVWAWGAAAHGELGNGTTPGDITTAVKVDFPAGVKITSLPNPMPFDAGLAIDSRGNVWGWGYDPWHELCLSAFQVLRPSKLPLTDVTLATGAREHALYYSKGTVYACGEGTDGALGDGSTATNARPVAVTGLPSGQTVKALTSSWNGSGALMSNGSYYDWGYNAQGQLGDGSTTGSPVPVRVSLPGTVTQVSQGGSGKTNGQTLAILGNGSVWAWGADASGQLGNGDTSNSEVPIQIAFPAGVTVAQVDSGGYACYAIDTTGKLWAWGSNAYGQLGLGSGIQQQTTPTSVGIDLTQVSSTARNGVGLGNG